MSDSTAVRNVVTISSDLADVYRGAEPTIRAAESTEHNDAQQYRIQIPGLMQLEMKIRCRTRAARFGGSPQRPQCILVCKAIL